MAADARLELEKLIREHGEDFASVSRLIGRNPAYIQQFIKRGTPQRLSEDDRSKLAAYFRVTEDRLGGPSQPIMRDIRAADARNADILFVPRVEVSASAGPGGIADIEPHGTPMAFDGALLRDLAGGNRTGLSMIRVAGDSMEPTLHDGDDILVDRNDGASRLREGIYVLRVEDVLIVKRLTPGSELGDQLVIRSDNPVYPVWDDYDAATMRLIGRVLWAGRRIA